jgi:hypothetical protein
MDTVTITNWFDVFICVVVLLGLFGILNNLIIIMGLKDIINTIK